MKHGDAGIVSQVEMAERRVIALVKAAKEMVAVHDPNGDWLLDEAKRINGHLFVALGYLREDRRSHGIGVWDKADEPGRTSGTNRAYVWRPHDLKE